jgi:hypothetical protein
MKLKPGHGTWISKTELVEMTRLRTRDYVVYMEEAQGLYSPDLRYVGSSQRTLGTECGYDYDHNISDPWA